MNLILLNGSYSCRGQKDGAARANAEAGQRSSPSALTGTLNWIH